MDGQHAHATYEERISLLEEAVTENQIAIADLEARVAALEQGTEPPVEPPPIEPPPIEPPTGHEHFDTERQKAGVFLSNSLRSDEEIRRFDVGRNRSLFEYDPTTDYAVCNVDKSSLHPRDQMYARFGRSFYSEDEFWAQWEFVLFDDMVQTSQSTHKAYRFDENESPRYEIQHRYSRTDVTAIATPTIRSYSGNVEGMNRDPVRDDIVDECAGMGRYDWQPGGDCLYPYKKIMSASDHLVNDPCYHTFVLRPNVGVRITVSRKDEYLRMWMKSDDDADTTLVIKRHWPDLSIVDMMRFEFNSSQGGEGPIHVGVRNAIYSTEPIAF